MKANSFSLPGLIYSVSASVMFGVTPWYLQLLASLNAHTLLWNRIIFSAACSLIALLWCKKWAEVRYVLTSTSLLLAAIVSTLVMMTLSWLFLWAPEHNKTSELSLGYFMMPLALALTGRVVYKETISLLQQVAIVCACIGVAYGLIWQRAIPWVTITITSLSPIYFILKRYIGISTLSGFTLECLFFLPVAIFALATDSSFWTLMEAKPDLWLLLLGLVALCSASFFFYIAASQRLPVSLFGLLTYLEPTIIFAISVLVLKEPAAREQYITYGCILIAAGIVCIDSMFLIRKSGTSVASKEG